jgi:hypothetical protein
VTNIVADFETRILTLFEFILVMNKKLIFILLTLFIGVNVFAQKGIIKGVLTEEQNNQQIPLPFANVYLEGTTIGTTSDFEGNFSISTQPGDYVLICAFMGYETFKKAIEVSVGGSVTVNIQMKPEGIAIDGVDVVAKLNRESEMTLMLEQKNAVIATQAIGAQELSRKGVSDAEGAVTNISGISKQEGVKNVFVRGLGDRYNATTLNGFPLPSEDPEYKNIALDFFSSDVIKTVGVNKVFSADKTGDVGGAIINIESKELNVDNELELSGSWGENNNTLGNNFLMSDGVNRFGYAKASGAPTSDDEADASYLFKNSLNPSEQKAGINQSYGFRGGRKLGDKVDFYLIGGYDHDYFYNKGVSRNTTQSGTLSQDFDYNKYIKTTNHQLMANVNYRFSPNSILSYNALYIHTNSSYYGLYEGFESNFESGDAYQGAGIMIRQQINDNTLLVNQLYGHFKLSDRWDANMGVSFNNVNGNEPDRRINRLYYSEEDILKYLGSEGNHQRYDGNLKENDLNAKAIFSYKFLGSEKDSKIDFGYTGRYVDRNFTALIYNHALRPMGLSQEYTKESLDMDEFFNYDNMGRSKYFVVDFYKDKYNVKTFIHSAFTNATFEAGDKLIVSGGLRADLVDLAIFSEFETSGDDANLTIHKLYILPSFNAKYSLNDKNAFRFGISKTYTLPQAKEISPFEYQDVTFRSKGYANLDPSQNYNIDLKWDFYLSNDELLTLTGFYKYIIDPISRVEIASANGFLSYRNIADHAIASGIELEFRKNIFKRVREENRNQLSFGLNGSYIYTHVNMPDDITGFYPTNSEAQLEGAAPFIVNSDLSYTIGNGNKKLSSSVIFNYTSDKIYTLGTNGYEDIVEKGIPTMDLVFSGEMGDHWGMNLKAKNILNPSYKLSRQSSRGSDVVVLNDYKKGLIISAGLSYAF